MREITIHRLYFTNNRCYQTSVSGPPAGIQVHSTGAKNSYLHRYVGPDDGLLGPNQYNNTHNRPESDRCGNAYIGKLQDGKTVAVYQTLPWDMHCWLSGSWTDPETGKADKNHPSANSKGFIGFEVCEDNRKNRAYFEDAVMDKSVNLCAYLCWKYDIPISAVRDHSELYKMKMASNHGDITWWLKNFGLNMDKYREAIQQAMAEGVRVKYIEGDKTWYDGPDGTTEPTDLIIEIEEPEGTMKQKMTVIGDGYLNLRAAPSKAAESIGKLYPGDTVIMTAEYPDGWAFVQGGGKQGYCRREYLEEPKEPETAEPADDPQEDAQDDAAAIIAEIIAATERLRELEDKLAALITGAVG